MPRHLTIAALTSALTTLVAALALRAADATLAIAAVAALAVLFAWYAQLHSDDGQAAGGLVNPASLVTLAVVGRQPWANVLPLVAAHVAGAVIAGFAVLGLEDELGDTLIFAAPSLIVAAIGAGVVGLIGAWATLSVDGGGPQAMAAVPAVVGGAILPLGLIAVYQPAAVLGLATAGLVSWDVALVAAGSMLVAAFVGAYAVSVLVPTE